MVSSSSTTTSGTINVRAILGGWEGFVASDAGTTAYNLGIDLVFPLGLYGTDGSGKLINQSIQVGIYARKVDDNGVAIGTWTLLDNPIITDRTVTPQARSTTTA